MELLKWVTMCHSWVLNSLFRMCWCCTLWLQPFPHVSTPHNLVSCCGQKIFPSHLLNELSSSLSKWNSNRNSFTRIMGALQLSAVFIMGTKKKEKLTDAIHMRLCFTAHWVSRSQTQTVSFLTLWMMTLGLGDERLGCDFMWKPVKV